MSFDPTRHHRRSIRLPGYDYTRGGAYFVTLCVQDRECLLGEVVEGHLRLNECGQAVDQAWRWLGQQYPYVKLDAWVVMPNHLHGILFMDAGAVERRKPLGRLIGAFKTVSTRRVGEILGRPGQRLWQRNFHERIVRGKEALERIRAYIRANPARWSRDRNRPRPRPPANPEA